MDDLHLVAARLPLERLRVLVVDDDDPAREVLQLLLESEGAVVTVASSAGAAFAALDHERPDVMLVDISMPIVDGFTFVEQLRLRTPERCGTVPVAALTGYVSAEDRERASRAGFQAYLVKPVEPLELIRTLKSLSAGSHS